MSQPDNGNQLDTLLMLQVRGEITPEQRKQLHQAMAANVEVLDYCLDFMVVAAGLERNMQMDDEAAATQLEALLHDRATQIREHKAGKRFSSWMMGAAAIITAAHAHTNSISTPAIRSQSRAWIPASCDSKPLQPTHLLNWCES